MTPVERSFSIGLLTENCSAKRINQAFKRRYKNETVQGNDDSKREAIMKAYDTNMDGNIVAIEEVD